MHNYGECGEDHGKGNPLHFGNVAVECLRQRRTSRLIGVFQLDQVAECHQGLIDRLDVAIGGKSVVAEDESGKVAFQGSPHTIASASISTS